MKFKNSRFTINFTLYISPVTRAERFYIFIPTKYAVQIFLLYINHLIVYNDDSAFQINEIIFVAQTFLDILTLKYNNVVMKSDLL